MSNIQNPEEVVKKLIVNKMSIEEAAENAVIGIYSNFPEISSIEELIIDYKEQTSVKVREAILAILIKRGFNPDNLIFL